MKNIEDYKTSLLNRTKGYISESDQILILKANKEDLLKVVCDNWKWLVVLNRVVDAAYLEENFSETDLKNARIFTRNNHEIRSGNAFALGTAKIRMRGKGHLYVSDYAKARAFDRVRIEAFNFATIKAYDFTSVHARDGVSVKAYNHASIEACNYVSVKAHNRSAVKVSGGAIVRAYETSRIVAFDSASVEAFDSVRVDAECAHSGECVSVKASGSAHVRAIGYVKIKASGRASVDARQHLECVGFRQAEPVYEKKCWVEVERVQ